MSSARTEPALGEGRASLPYDEEKARDPTIGGSDTEGTLMMTPGDGNGKPAEPDATPAPAWGSDAPDGGMAAWLCVLGAWCAGFCTFGWVNSVGVFQAYYETGPLKDYSSSTIAWIPSLQIFFMMGTGPIVGKLFDDWGPRPLIIGGTLMHVFGLMMASLSTKYYQFLLAQGVCSAIGVSAIFQPSISCIPGWFSTKRGAAYGILATGSSTGGVIFPIMLQRLIKSTGYAWSMRGAAFLILGLLVISVLTVTTFKPPRPSHLSRKQMIQPFREPAFALTLAGIFMLTFGIFSPIDYLQVDALEQGMSPDIAQYIPSIFNAGSFFGRLISGIVADKVGRFNVFAVATGTAGILCVSLWLKASSNAAMICFAVLFGFSSGAYISLLGALIAQISPLPEIGYRTGVLFLNAAIPGLVTSPISGAILDSSGGWKGLKAFAGATVLIGTVFIFLARLTQTGMKLFISF